MVIGKVDSRTALVLANNGKVYLQSVAEPWKVEEVDTGPPEEEDSFPFNLVWHQWLHYLKGVA